MLSSEEFYQSELQRFTAMYPGLRVETLEQWARDRQRRRDIRLKNDRAARAKAIAMLGGICGRCGEDDHSIIEIDHVDPVLGKRNGSTAREALKAKGRGFQLLCMRCHQDKSRFDYFRQRLHRDSSGQISNSQERD
jgi:5-methylcytosine-specific restriction endonuclease McrA